MVGPAEDRLRIADLHDPPEVHDRDPVGEVAHHAKVVRDQQVAGLAFGLQLGQDVQDRGLDGHVERTRGLVGNDDAGVAGEGAGDRHALLEAARQLARFEVQMALGETQVGGQLVDAVVGGLALEPGQLAHGAAQDLAHAPAPVERRIGVLEDDLDRALGLDRTAGGGRVELVVVELDRTPGVGPLDAEDGLGQRRLPRPGLADEAQRLAVVEREVDLDERRDAVAALVEGLGHVREREDLGSLGRDLADARVGLRDVADAVVVVAARPVADAHVDDGRHHGPAELVGERAAVDVDAGRQVRPDLGQRARDRGERALALAHPVARQRAQEAHRVGELRALEHLDGVALLHDLARVHHADAVAQGADHPEVVGDEQDRGIGLVAQRPDQVEDARLDRGIETGRGLVEHEQLGIGGQRHRDHDALLHPARELMRVAIEDADRVGDVDAVEGGQRVLAGPRPDSGRGP